MKIKNFIIALLILSGIYYLIDFRLKGNENDNIITDIWEKNSKAENISKVSLEENFEHENNNEGLAKACPFILPNDNWSIETQSLIRDFLIELQKTDVDESEIDYFAYYSGIGIDKARLLRNGYQTDVTRPPFSDRALSHASIEENKVVEEFIRTGDISNLISSIIDGQLSNNSFYVGKHSLVFLLTLVMESFENSALYIEELLDAGIEPELADLFFASKINLDIAILERMYNSSSVDASVTVLSHGVFKSLVLEALINNNFEHTLFWISKNSPLEPEKLKDNALDILAENGRAFTYAQNLQLFELFLSRGIEPNRYQSLDILDQKLTTELKDKFQSQLIFIHNYGFSNEELVRINSQINNFFNLILSGANIEISELDKKCYISLSRKYVKYALQDHINKNIERLNEDNEKTLLLGSQNKSNVNQTNNDVVNSLYTKNEYRSNTIEKLKLIPDPLKAENLSEASQDIQPTIEEVIQLIIERKWYEALNILKNNLIDDSASSNTLMLSISLGHNPPLEFIDYLIDNGANIYPDNISPLIKTDNIQIAEFLLDKGLDLQYIDPIGNSVLSLSVQNKSTKMLTFLLRNGAREPINNKGLDALDYALQNFKLSSQESDFFVRSLINNDFKIETSHKQITSELFTKDIASYTYLINNFPSLR